MGPRSSTPHTLHLNVSVGPSAFCLDDTTSLPSRDRKGSDASKGIGVVDRASCKFLRSIMCPPLQTCPPKQVYVHRSMLLLHQMQIRPSHETKVPPRSGGGMWTSCSSFLETREEGTRCLGKTACLALLFPMLTLPRGHKRPVSSPSDPPVPARTQPIALRGVCDNEGGGMVRRSPGASTTSLEAWGA